MPPEGLRISMPLSLLNGIGDRSYSSFKGSYKIDDFFKINERTKEKEEYIKTVMNV